MKLEKLLFAIAAGVAAAKLTEQQQETIAETVEKKLIDELSIIDDVSLLVNSDLPRGIRNNNPGNIRYDGTNWQGLDNPPSDGTFCRFVDVKYGIRAMARILTNYQKRGIVSVRDIISTWASATENNTSSYIMHVASKLDLLIDAPVPSYKWPALIDAIIQHENGQQPYTMAQIQTGIALA
jgi:hypothetical protein